MAWVEKDHNDHQVSTPLLCSGRQPLYQAAQSHIQPGLECLQGWGIHNFLGQPVQCVTTLWGKNFLLTFNPNLPCLSLKPFPLVLSPSTLVNSHSPPVSTFPSSTGRPQWGLPAAFSSPLVQIQKDISPEWYLFHSLGNFVWNRTSGADFCCTFIAVPCLPLP